MVLVFHGELADCAAVHDCDVTPAKGESESESRTYVDCDDAHFSANNGRPSNFWGNAAAAVGTASITVFVMCHNFSGIDWRQVYETTHMGEVVAAHAMAVVTGRVSYQQHLRGDR